MIEMETTDEEYQALQLELEDFDWSVLDELDGPHPDYNNSGALDVHLYSEAKAVDDAAKFICNEIGYVSDRALTHMKVMLLNLFWVYHLCPDRWVGVSLNNNRYGIPFRYNPQRIELHPLKQVIAGLIRRKYLVRRKGFNATNPKNSRCTRMKATAKLIDMLVDMFGFTPDMVGRCMNEEVICLKNEKKEPVGYHENKKTPRMRRFLNEYNTFLQHTYIDVDYKDYVHVKKLRKTKSEYKAKLPTSLTFNLASRKMRRIFNNGSFTQGGRFYNAFWMEMPSQLRLRIILDFQKVIEADYSGIHIHLLYNKIGIDYGAKKRDPYAIPGYPETKEYRNLFKKLLLAAVNAKRKGTKTGETRAIMALRDSITKSEADYPAEIPDLHKVIADFKQYHWPIANFLFTGQGFNLMYKDSQIAELVMKTMYKHRIPVLPVHDSFICPKQHKDLLVDTMTLAYRSVTGSKLTMTPFTVNIKEPDEWDRTEGDPTLTDEDYYYDPTLCSDDTLIEHMLKLEGDALFDDEEDDTPDSAGQIVTPHRLIVRVPVQYV